MRCRSALRAKPRHFHIDILRYVDTIEAALFTPQSLGALQRSGSVTARRGIGRQWEAFRDPRRVEWHIEAQFRVRPTLAAYPPKQLMSEEIPLVRVLVVLSNEQRLDILRKLKTPGSFPPQDEGDPLVDGVCVSSIQAGQGLAFSTTSKYLADLAGVGLVLVKRVGKWSYYRRNEPAIQALINRMSIDL